MGSFVSKVTASSGTTIDVHEVSVSNFPSDIGKQENSFRVQPRNENIKMDKSAVTNNYSGMM
jgi:hypothetical protein